MFQLNIMICILILSLIFMQMKHPLSVGLILLLQTVFSVLLTGMMYQSFWFSYILFLIFIGGMLVLFIYVTSLASNELFNLSSKLLIILMLSFMLLMFISIWLDKTLTSLTMNYEMLNYSNNYIFMNENLMNINKLFNFPTNFITLLMINYLLFTLIVIVKITNFYFGPLRSLN